MAEVEINGRKRKIASRADAVGLFCPLPIVHLTVALEKVNPNQIVEILADDHGFEKDIIHRCIETKNNLLWLTKNEKLCCLCGKK